MPSLGVRPDAVLIPCGGGGLSAGIGLAAPLGRRTADIVHRRAARISTTTAVRCAAGRIVANEAMAGSVCDALLAPAPGSIGFALNRPTERSPRIRVSDDEALAAVAFAFSELKLVVEPGGAVALAALLAGRFIAPTTASSSSSSPAAISTRRCCSRLSPAAELPL